MAEENQRNDDGGNEHAMMTEADAHNYSHRCEHRPLLRQVRQNRSSTTKATSSSTASPSARHLPLTLLAAAATAFLIRDGSSPAVVLAQETDGAGAAAVAATVPGVPTTPDASATSTTSTASPSCARSPPTCSSRYYKISDESNGLATSCAAVDQTKDPVIGLDQAGCQAACDGLEGCDTINFRWKDPNFNGESTCYRKNCGYFKTAACTLFSKHKSRDVYTKACGAAQLFSDHVITDSGGLFAGVQCPDETDPEVSNVLQICATDEASISNAEEVPTSCTQMYYKISDEFNGLATSCAAVDQTKDPVIGLDQAGCQAACDGLEGCDTVNFRWNDPNFNGESTCYRKNCGSFETATCTLFSKHKSRDVFTKADFSSPVKMMRKLKS